MMIKKAYLAERVDFWYWSTGNRRFTPNVDSVMEAADYLNVSIDYLVGRDR